MSRSDAAPQQQAQETEIQIEFMAPESQAQIARGVQMSRREHWLRSAHLATPFPLILLGGLAGLAAIVAGVVLYAIGTREFGVFLIACGPIGWILLSGTILLSRRKVALELAGRDELAEDSGRSSRSQDPWEPAPGQLGGGSEYVAKAEFTAKPTVNSPISRRRWVGGMNVPAATGRFSATLPLAVLEISDGDLTMRIRPRWVRSIVGAETLQLTPGSKAVLFPVNQLAGIGIGIRSPGRPSWYFRSFSSTQILAAASAAGFEVADSLGRWGV